MALLEFFPSESVEANLRSVVTNIGQCGKMSDVPGSRWHRVTCVFTVHRQQKWGRIGFNITTWEKLLLWFITSVGMQEYLQCKIFKPNPDRSKIIWEDLLCCVDIFRVTFICAVWERDRVWKCASHTKCVLSPVAQTFYFLCHCWGWGAHYCFLYYFTFKTLKNHLVYSWTWCHLRYFGTHSK